jgi:hypothetical protein
VFFLPECHAPASFWVQKLDPADLLPFCFLIFLSFDLYARHIEGNHATLIFQVMTKKSGPAILCAWLSRWISTGHEEELGGLGTTSDCP